MEKTIELTCTSCNGKFNRRLAEYKRSQLGAGRLPYCSLSCSGKAQCGNFGQLTPEERKRSAAVARSFLPPAEPMNFFLRVSRRRKSKGLYNMTAEYLWDLWNLQGGLCAVSGVKIALPLGSNGFEKARSPFNASLDRIDNAKGYMEGNVRFVALIVNIAISNWGEQSLYDLVDAMLASRLASSTHASGKPKRRQASASSKSMNTNGSILIH